MEHQVVENSVENITEVVRRAQEREQSWTLDSVAAVLQSIKVECEGGLVDWEPGNEEWGRILVGDLALALVCSRLPLVIIQTPHDKKLHNQDSFETLKVDSMSRKAYSADRQFLEAVFEKRLSDHVDCGRLSIDELWLATV